MFIQRSYNEKSAFYINNKIPNLMMEKRKVSLTLFKQNGRKKFLG